MAQIPIYQAVYEKLRGDITSGVYHPGEVLPTETELEQMFHVSRTTVRKAVAILQSQGLISVRQGYGTIVLSNRPEDHYHKFHNVTGVREVFLSDDERFTLRGSRIEATTASGKVAKALEVPEGAPIYRMQRLLCLKDEPFCFISNYLRQEYFPGLDAFSGKVGNLYAFIERQYGVYFERGDEIISAATADFIDAGLLGVAIGTPLLFCMRTAFWKGGVLEYVESKLRPDLYELHLIMEGAPSQDYFRG
jgi:DNA-binding GntR family transcriptional regulator